MKMNNQDEPFDLYQGQVQTYAGFASFMSAAVFFFIGLLLTKFSSFDNSVKIPIIFLIISAFAFLYGGILYTGAADEVSRKKAERFHRVIRIGDSITEYVGIYLLVLAIPLVINAVTSDTYLRVATVLAAIVGLAVYQWSGFALAEIHFGEKHHVVSTIVVLTGVALWFAQIYNYYFVPLASAFIIFSLLVALSASKRKSELKQ